MAKVLPKMKLWYYPMYRSTRCVWLVKELGIEDSVDLKLIDMTAPPTAPERSEYQKFVHPHGTIPALEIKGCPPMLESGSICMYLADLCGRLVPEPENRSEYYDWIVYSTSRLDVALDMLGSQWVEPKDKQDEQIISKAQTVASVCLDRAEQTLQDRTFILGEEFSAADCMFGFNVIWASHSLMNNGILMNGRPKLKAYMDRLQARPALKQTMAMGE